MSMFIFNLNVPACSFRVILVFRMRKIYNKLDKMTDLISYFLINEWDIKNDNILAIWDNLSEDEKRIFNFDVNSISIENYFKNLATGLKKFILKEDMSKTDYHIKRYNRWV